MIYPWHRNAWRQLAEHWQQQPNAWLLAGRENTGKTEFARSLAQALLCEKPQADQTPLKPHTDIQGEVVKVQTARGEFPVPKNPERVAVYDFGALDTLTALGVNVGATVDDTNLGYLKPAVEKAQHVGTLFEPNYEALNAFKPQLIITGSRTNKAIHQLNEIAPTVEMTADTKNLIASAKERIDAYAQIFGKQAEADKLKADIHKALDEAEGESKILSDVERFKNDLAKLGAYGYLAQLNADKNQGIGITPVDAQMKEGSHGMPVSFEYLKEKNPDWLFVLDRSAAIGEEGQAAKDVLNNPLVAETTAWKKGQVVYLDSGTYLAAGGARQLQTALKQVTEALAKAK